MKRTNNNPAAPPGEIPPLVSFSGGKTSAFMSRFLQTHYPQREVVFAFANTGKEREETLEFVNECDVRWGLQVVWLEAVINPEFGKGTTHKVVSFEAAARNGEPFEAMIAKYGIPNAAFKHCSRELKARVIASYVKNDLGWQECETAIGIRADEAYRINRQEAGKRGWVYPLTDEIPTNKKIVNQWWERQPFTLHLKEHEGNCDLCWKKSDKKLVRLATESPQRLAWWDEMERKYSTLQIPHRQRLAEPAYFFRGNKSAADLMLVAAQAANDSFVFEALSEDEQDCFCKST
jgi:hypothetical protein